MKIDYRLMLIVVTISALFAFDQAFAHITNEASQGAAAETSASGGDIMLLVAAEIIPETPDFEPDVPLSQADLAAWAAFAAGLGEDAGTADALAALALEHELVASLIGDAVCRDINELFFGGQLVIDDPEAVPTRGEAATFIAANLGSSAGEVLLGNRNLRLGPTGVVAQIEKQRKPDGGITYFITVGATRLAMYAHGRVGNGPTDLMQWEGRSVRRSLVRRLGDRDVWAYLEAESIPAVPE